MHTYIYIYIYLYYIHIYAYIYIYTYIYIYKIYQLINFISTNFEVNVTIIIGIYKKLLVEFI